LFLGKKLKSLSFFSGEPKFSLLTLHASEGSILLTHHDKSRKKRKRKNEKKKEKKIKKMRKETTVNERELRA
jgi:flagellar biosynthesis component FlhA